MSQAQTISAPQVSPSVLPPVLPPALPQAKAVIGYATPIGAADAMGWHGKDLVMSSGASIADRCIRCNEPSDGTRIRRNLTWFSPLLYFLLIGGGPLLFALGVMLFQRRATVYVGLCEAHRARRQRGVLIAWGLVLGAVASFVLTIFVADASELAGNVLLGLSVLGVIAAIVLGIVLAQQIGYAKYIDGPFVWLRGVNRGYPSRNNQPVNPGAAAGAPTGSQATAA